MHRGYIAEYIVMIMAMNIVLDIQKLVWRS